MANFTYRTSAYSPKSIYSYKTFTQYAWNHFAPETEGNCTWFAFGETSRIVQECLGNESYNIQYESGNEFMTYGPNALLWISNAHSKGAWNTYGDTRGNYNPSSSSMYGTQINVQAGDILCYWSSDGYGHVEVVERIDGNNVYCSGSKARASQPAVLYYSRIVVKSQFTVGRQHTFSGKDADGNIITWSNDYFQGVIRNPYVSDSPTPPTPTPGEEPAVTVYPSSYDSIMLDSEDYLNFNFTIVVTGIPSGEDARDAISFSTNCYRYAYTTGWSYTEYVIDGVTYQSAQRSLIVRYDRLHNTAYTDTAYMYYRKTFSNGSVNSSTPMRIQIRAKSSAGKAYLYKRKRKRFLIKLI